MRILISGGVLIIAALLLSACQTSTGLPAAIDTRLPPTLLPSATHTLPPADTATPLPTATPSLTPTIIPTFTPYQPPTITPRPTATLTYPPAATRYPTSTPGNYPTYPPAGSVSSTVTPSPMPAPTLTPASTLTPLPTGDPPEMVSREEWGALPPQAAYQSHTPERITIHDDGIYFADDDDPVMRLKTIQTFGMNTHGWADIPYHYLIDRKGVIYEGLPTGVMGYTATDYNPRGHISVTLLGEYNRQQVTAEQEAALIKLLAWLSLDLRIPADRIGGHRDYAVTTCPGEQVYNRYLATGFLFTQVQARIDAILAGSR